MPQPPKYAEDPMGYLRSCVASATHQRLADLKKQAEQAKREYEKASDFFEMCKAEAEAGTLTEIDVSGIMLGSHECWKDALDRIKAVDDEHRNLYWSVCSHPSDRQDITTGIVCEIWPDFNPAPGIAEGLARFKEANK